MAHQCWNDGTDRSTLPIHGTPDIGTTIDRAATEVDGRVNFSQRGKPRREHVSCSGTRQEFRPALATEVMRAVTTATVATVAKHLTTARVLLKTVTATLGVQMMLATFAT